MNDVAQVGMMEGFRDGNHSGHCEIYSHRAALQLLGQ